MAKKRSRNAPCHCGSGIKYKKCCLPVEEAARAAAVGRKPEPVRDVMLRDWEPSRGPRQALWAGNLEESYWVSFFAELADADLDRQLAMAYTAIDQAPGFDDEWVFKLTLVLAADLRFAGRAAEHDALIDCISKKHPEAAAMERVWLDLLQLVNAVQRPDGQALAPALRLAAGVIDDFSTLRAGIVVLMYHGRASDALAACDAAWSRARDTDELAQWNIEELQDTCIRLTFDSFVDHAEAWDSSRFALEIAKYLPADEAQSFSQLDDIGEQRYPGSRTIVTADEILAATSGSAKGEMARLIVVQFIHALHEQWGWPRSRCWLAYREMLMFLSGAIEILLLSGYSRASSGKRRKNARKRHARRGVAKWLVASPGEVARFLARREELGASLSYELSAFILALPRWWQFLGQLGVVSDRKLQELLSAVPRLVGDLAERIADDSGDPVPYREIVAMVESCRDAARRRRRWAS